MSVVTSAASPKEVLSREPLVRATPAYALGLERMPTEAHFRRDHFAPPSVDLSDWRLTIEGLVDEPLELGLDELMELPRRELTVVLECAGHRRAEFEPETRGLAWKTGAIGEATWAGASLADVLGLAGLCGGRYVMLEGADRGPFRGAGDFAFARALPIEKALDPDTVIAWEMNDESLPIAHGAPARVVVPGWYATDSIKWLNRIAVRQDTFDGPFEAVDYRLAPGAGPGTRLTDLPVHALLVSARDGDRIAAGESELRGIAWGGDGGVARVEVSIDGGAWEAAALAAPSGPYARAHWSLTWLAEAGSRTIAVRAIDAAGKAQPLEPRWNEGGYANSSAQRVRIQVD
jgi:DMSO/TMAO reductase YedYZ molybdopterin-dependent catalytic subunit